MSVGPQGFRHAATLLLTNGVRAIPPNASPEAARTALERLAHELVALALDTRAPAEAAKWLAVEFNTTIDRLPQSFDRGATKSAAAPILARVASLPRSMVARDLFLIYAPEDRLPFAAPVAIELTKRRVSVAFAEYEVTTAPQFESAVAQGLTCHRGGVVLWTAAFEQMHPRMPPPEHHRVLVLRQCEISSAVANVAKWARTLEVSKT